MISSSKGKIPFLCSVKMTSSFTAVYLIKEKSDSVIYGHLACSKWGLVS